MKTLKINRLVSGGVITNYFCSSKCRHCLYGSSPKWEKRYMDEDTAASIFLKIISTGCSSVHIGGGEPFLNIAALEKVVEVASREGIDIEYIETNSSWYKDEKSALGILGRLREKGIRTLLVSMSPFHNEYIPFYKVKAVIAACKEAGISVFPWVWEFYAEIDAFDDRKPHDLSEYCRRYGKNYVRELPMRYWINFGGRALETYKDLLPQQDTETIINRSTECRELENTSHFHIDLFGNYIPGLCSGIAISVDDIGRPLDAEKYPLIYTLYNEGVRGLLEIAQQKYGFIPKKRYLSKCHLCFDIRRFLVIERKLRSCELQPVEFYERV